MRFAGLFVIAALFSLGVQSRNLVYDTGLIRPRRLRGGVVSIGNLSVGGAGKTPFLIMLGEMLQERGVKFDVLSRGYGRQSRGVKLVDPNGTAREFGDEPLLIARKLQVPVVVGESRYRAGLLAEEKFGPQLHLLDDGFQHRSLVRDFDIVLLTPEDARDRMLPSGRLREPLRALRRADAVVLTRGAEAAMFPLDGKMVWKGRRHIMPRTIPTRPIVFCGLARPQNFFTQLRTAGIDAVAEMAYRDHHPYTAADVRELLDLRKRKEAGGFVTTEKDAINLADHMAELGPIAVVPLKMKMQDSPNVIDTILAAVEKRARQRETMLQTG